MSHEETKQKHPDIKERYAVCNGIFDQHKKHAKAVVQDFDDEILIDVDEAAVKADLTKE